MSEEIDIEEHITEKSISAYLFKCPNDSKEIEDQSRERVKKQAEQHIALKHDQTGDSDD